MARITYKAPKNSAERIAEARKAIARLTTSYNGNVANRVGRTGEEHKAAIASWQATIDAETSKAAKGRRT